MLYLPNEYSQESSLKICVFKTDGSRWAMRSRRLPNPSPPRRRGRPPPKAAAEQGLTEMRHVTEIKAMPRGRKPDGEHALSNAERQARYRAHRLTKPSPVVTRTRRSTDRCSRPQRWRNAVAELLALQAEYARWLTGLPDSLRDTATAEALEALADLELTALADIEPPRGYGRD